MADPHLDTSLESTRPRGHAVEEAAQSVVAVGFSAVPVFGPAVAEAFNRIANTMARRDYDQWLDRLARTVDDLAARRSMSVEAVVSDPVFYQALVRATRIAQETTNSERRQILQNAVSNSGSWAHNPEALQTYFLRMLGRYEAEHVYLLRLASNVAEWLKRRPSLNEATTLNEVFGEHIFPGIAGWEPLASVLTRDLYNDGLLQSDVGLGMTLGRGPGASTGLGELVTETGLKFLRYCERFQP